MRELSQPAIDYSDLLEPPSTQSAGWETPRKVFFGKRDPNTGRMEQEPVYTYQAYPSVMYKMVDDVLRARLAKDADGARDLKADGWSTTPATFGYIGAPSQEELAAAEARAIEEKRLKELVRPETRLKKFDREVTA